MTKLAVMSMLGKKIVFYGTKGSLVMWILLRTVGNVSPTKTMVACLCHFVILFFVFSPSEKTK